MFLLYELLAKHQFQEIKEINISVSDLKTMLLVENKYKLFGHFHDRVIKPAVEQINKHSNFIADYELIKKSRSFSDIKFKFKLKKTLKKISDKAEIITITNEIIDKNARPGETKYVVATRLVASGKYKHAQRKTKE
jgi:plasmid replication initiation protein